MSDYSVQISDHFRIASGEDCLMMSLDGYVDALLEFFANNERAMTYVYAPLGQIPADSPVPGCGMAGEEYWHLEETGRISSFYDLMQQSGAEMVYRVEDFIGGASWLVSFDTVNPGFRFGQVYVCQPNGCLDPKMSTEPPEFFEGLGEFLDYIAHCPNILIESYDQLGRSPGEVYGGEGVRVVLDIAAMLADYPD